MRRVWLCRRSRRPYRPLWRSAVLLQRASGSWGRQGSRTSDSADQVGGALADLHPGLRISPDKPGYRPRVILLQIHFECLSTV
jgi:hypothetical protein